MTVLVLVLLLLGVMVIGTSVAVVVALNMFATILAGAMWRRRIEIIIMLILAPLLLLTLIVFWRG